MQWWIRPGTQPGLRDGEAGTFFMNQIGARHAYVAQQHLAVAAWKMVIHHRNIAHDGETRRIERHDHHALAPIGRGIGVGDAHDDRKFAQRMRGAGDKPFASVDDVFIAVAANRQLDIRRIGRRDIGFAHREAGTDGAVQQRREPAFALLLRREHLQQFHVAGVRRAAVESFRSPVHAPHDFGERCVLEIGQPLLRFVRIERRQEEIP